MIDEVGVKVTKNCNGNYDEQVHGPYEAKYSHTGIQAYGHGWA